MSLNGVMLASLRTMLAGEDVDRIEANARTAERIERTWSAALDKLLADLADELLGDLEADGELAFPDDIAKRIGELLFRHEIATVEAAQQSVGHPEYVRASAPKWPHDPARIRALWDTYRKTGKLPKRTAEQARAIKTLYIRTVQKIWQRHGEDFVAGKPKEIGRDERGVIWNSDAFDREGARALLQDAVRVPRARGRTIIETETTRYYNTTRVNTYNQIETVVAYLFVAVRDHATTKWCRSRAGVVFFKGTDLQRRNMPPCHYNCRSELLPLSRLNPAHRRIVEDRSLWASNRKLVPLMAEWNK